LPLERVSLVIGGLGTGGSEQQVRILAAGLARSDIHVTLIVLNPGTWETDELNAAGVGVRVLPQTLARGPGRLWRLATELRAARPQVVYSMLPLANVMAAVARGAVPDARLVWGVRGSDRSVDVYPWRIRLLRRLHVALAGHPDLTICNSLAGAEAHKRAGGDPARTVVVRNALLTDRFCFDPVGRQQVRTEWGAGDSDVFALVGNLDPVKGHEHFLLAAALVVGHSDRARFVVVGDGPASRRHALQALASDLGLGERVRFTGVRTDLVAVYSASDVVVSASTSEGLPNVLAEAMACERVCVATDVGDSSWLLDDTGLLVPSATSASLANAMCKAAGLTQPERDEIGRRGRARVCRELSADTMIERTRSCLEDLVA